MPGPTNHVESGRWTLGVKPGHLVLILSLAALVRLAALLFVSHPELLEGQFEFNELSDETQYHNVALAVAQSGRYLNEPGGLPTARRTPGSTLPIAAIYRLFGPRPVLAVAYVVSCSLICVFLVGVIADRIMHCQRVTITAMILAGLSPSMVLFSAGIWSDPPALLWVLSALLLVSMIREDRESLIRWVLLGTVLAFAYLTRTSNAILVAGILLSLLIFSLRRRRLLSFVAFASTAAVPVLLWGIHNQAALGKFIIGSTLQAEALFRTNNPVAAGLEMPAIRHFNGYDLYDEAEKGMFHGKGVPQNYVLPEVREFAYGPAEVEENNYYLQQTKGFIKESPSALPRLVAYKAMGIVTAEPSAPSVLGISTENRRIRWAAAICERWLFLGFGFAGLLMLYLRGHAARHTFALFVACGLISTLTGSPSGRNLLPVTACLSAPAAMAIVYSMNKASPGGIWREEEFSPGD